jgi:hypothetical protein
MLSYRAVKESGRDVTRLLEEVLRTLGKEDWDHDGS